MYCLHFGKEGAHPVVILPGLSIGYVTPAARQIKKSYKILAENYEIFLFDRRAGDLPASYSVQAMADDTALVMEHMGIGSAGLFGVSQGGMMAQELVIRHPQLVDALILGSTSCRTEITEDSSVTQWKNLAKAALRAPEEEFPDRVTELFDAFARAVYTPGFYDMVKRVLPVSAAGVSRHDLERFIILSDGMIGFDTRAHLNEITCPVLAISAGKDRVFPEGASQELADLLGCPSYVYEDYGHAVYDEAPDYAGRLREFFDSVYA